MASNADQYNEHIILSAMMNNLDLLCEGINSIEERDFYFLENRAMFKVLNELYQNGTSPDIEAIITKMRKEKDFDEARAIQYVKEVYMLNPSIYELSEYIKILSEMSKCRKLVDVGLKISQDVPKIKDSPEQYIEEVKILLKEIEGNSKSSTSLQNKEVYDNFKDGMSLKEYYNDLHEKVSCGIEVINGVSSGYPSLDKLIGNFTDGSLTYVGARTSMGKSTFIINLMANQLFDTTNPPKTLIFSLEMPCYRVLERLACVKAGIDHDLIARGKASPQDRQAFIDCAERNRDIPLTWESTSLSINQLKARARRLHDTKGLDIIYVDLLSKVKADQKHHGFHLEVGEVSKGLHDIAHELNIPVVCLAQLNREVTSRTDKNPQLSDFKNSGSIEEDSDLCILLHRPEYYEKGQKPGITQVRVAKNRILGNLGTVELVMKNNRLVENVFNAEEFNSLWSSE